MSKLKERIVSNEIINCENFAIYVVFRIFVAIWDEMCLLPK